MQTSRRSFLKGMGIATAAAAGGVFAQDTRYPSVSSVAPHFADKNEKLNIGVVGVCGKGWSDWTPMFNHGENIVALCDCDRNHIKQGLEEIAKKRGRDYAAKVKTYTDYRKMLDACGKILHAVTVSTPDHMHAPAAITAMRMGISAYVQKPLVRTIWEANYFAKVAKTCGVVTQMGNQGSDGGGLRRNVELLQMGLLGDVKEVHVWTNRPVWPQGLGAKKAAAGAADNIPDNLDWEAFVGPAKMRNFKNGVFHTFKWRGFYDFGAGAFGDMACHTMNVPFRGLELGKVTHAVCTKIEGFNDDAYPDKSIVELTYAARESRVRPGVTLPAVKLYWYDGNLKPSPDLMPQVIAELGGVPNTGCLIIGSKGIMCSTNDYGQEAFVAMKGEAKVLNANAHPACAESAIKTFIPRCRSNNYIEFVDAVKGQGNRYEETHSLCYADREHSVPMLEAMLVGCVAQRVPNTALKWDSANQLFDNAAANRLVRPYIRKGYEF